MGFGQEMKDFVAAAQAGWKMMTPTQAEVNAAALRESIAENKRRAAAMGAGGTGGNEPARTVSSGGGGSSDEEASSGFGSDTGTYTPSDKDLDIAVRTVYGEAAGESDEGQKAVAAVLKNRANLAGTSLTAEALKPNQFEPWNNPVARRRMTTLKESDPRYQKIKSNVLAVIEEGEDPTKGATHFYAPTAQQKLGRSTPSWATGKRQTIGNHVFFKLPYSGRGTHGTDEPEERVMPATAPMPPTGRPAVDVAAAPAPASAAVVAPTAAIPVRRVRTTPAPAVAVDPPPGTAISSETGLPIPPDDPRLQHPEYDRVHGRTSAIGLDLYPEDDPYLRSGIYAARGGLVPSYADGGAVDLDQEELGGVVEDDDVTPARAQADFAAIRSMGDNPLAYIAYAANKGLTQIQDRFGLNSGAVPAESPRAQDGARALAANAGAPDPAMVKQLQDTADPQGKMTPDQRAVHGWANLIKYYTEQGNPQAVANAGAAMLMHSKRVSQQAGAMALAAIEKGDYQTAAKAIQAAYNTFPNGQSVRVNTAGEDGIEYSVVTAGGGVGKDGKISPEELKQLATGMLNGSEWFQHATQLTNMPAAKPADIAKQRQIKAIQSFEEKVPEDARGVEDLDKDLRKAWANLPSPYRREQEKKWRDLKKQDKTEEEQAAEANYATADAKDDFLASRTETQLADYLKMNDKGKARAIAAFKEDRKQHFAEQKFDDRMERQLENRDRSEALKLFGMAQRYGMWAKTREQVLTENEKKLAQREAEEAGRDKRQGLSIAQQNKIQENIDRRIIEKRTATHDASGARLTAPEAREQRRLGAVDAREEAALTSLDERMGTGVAPDESAGMGEVAAQRIQRGRQFEERAAPYRTQTGFERMTAGPEAKARAFDPEDYKAIKDDIVKRWSAPTDSGGKRKALSEADQHVLTSIGSDIMRTGNMPAEYASNLTVRALDPKTPLKIMPDRSVMIGEGTNRQPVFLSGESMLRLAELRARVGAPPSTGGPAVELETAPRRTLREQIQAPAKARQEQRSAIDLATAAARQPDGSQYQAMKEQLGDWYREGMSFAEMQQALRDKYALEGTRPSIQRRGTR